MDTTMTDNPGHQKRVMATYAHRMEPRMNPADRPRRMRPMSEYFVTFGQKYRHEHHPVLGNAYVPAEWEDMR